MSSSSSTYQHISSTNIDVFKTWLSNIDTFLLDVDGVLLRGHTAIPNTGKTIETLRKIGKKLYFVSNNTTKTRNTYAEALCKAGIPAKPEEIITSAYAASQALVTHNIDKKVFVIGSEALATELSNAANVTTIGGHKEQEHAFEFGQQLTLDPDVQAVVCAFDSKLTYSKLAHASSYLRYQQPRCLYIATNLDATFPDSQGLCPGGGSVNAALITASGRHPDMVAGKPSSSFFTLVQQMTNCVASRTCMVGDRLDTDIHFGNQAMLYSTLLVFTGVISDEVELQKLLLQHTEKEHHHHHHHQHHHSNGSNDSSNEKNHTNLLIPTHIINSFGDIHDLVEKHIL